jgi:Na+/H+ antiporter NhaD/arsenite permease-like protein
MYRFLLAALATTLPNLAHAATVIPTVNLTATTLGLVALSIFILGYAIVISEEFTHLRKSIPVIIAASAIWVLVAVAYAVHGLGDIAARSLRDNLLEYAELMLFLLSAMTFINTMEERSVFKALRSWMVRSGFTLRTIYWLTGVLAFFISPVADNLTTALLMAAVALAVAHDNKRFIVVACINIVVAANAGGAFSPFGDITTLMVWQKGVVNFHEFFGLFVPSLVNWLVPAALMAVTVPKERPTVSGERIDIKFAGYLVIGLFFATIATTVTMHHYLHLPPFLGMMTGLGLLKVIGYEIRRRELKDTFVGGPEFAALHLPEGYKPAVKPFDIFISMKRAEWDTLMFFYGVVLCVGGIGAFGYLAVLSQAIYQGLGPSTANVLIGIASAVIDNIPIMYAVLTMNPEMSLGQWLLVTLTAGVGGSLLSIGSAAGVGLMGQARGTYTFFAHFKWTWAIALGYAASIWVHFLINRGTF